MQLEQPISQDLFTIPEEIKQESMLSGLFDDQLPIALYQKWTIYLKGQEQSIENVALHQPAEEIPFHSEEQFWAAAKAASQHQEAINSQESNDQIASSISTRSSSGDKADIFPKKTARKRKANPSTDKETRNIVNNILRKAAREYFHDASAQSIVKHKLSQQGIAFSDFQDLLMNIIIRYSTSARELLHLYLNPKKTDPKYHLKLIFAEYFKFYMENYLTLGLIQEEQIKNRQLYINHVRHYLAYLDQTHKIEQFDCRTTRTFEKLSQF